MVGTIPAPKAMSNIVVERVTKGKEPAVWLFSRATLERIPELNQEIGAIPIETIVPKPLRENRIANVPVFEWLGLFVALPCYLSPHGSDQSRSEPARRRMAQAAAKDWTASRTR